MKAFYASGSKGPEVRANGLGSRMPRGWYIDHNGSTMGPFTTKLKAEKAWAAAGKTDIRMSPAAYNAARRRLRLTHRQAAELLRISLGTSRNWALPTSPGADERAEAQLRLIEHIGVEEARAILLGENKMR